MEEVITRRLKHSIENPKGGFGILPDVIFADGGITQIRATKKAVQKYDLNIPVFGMVKNDKHQTRALMDENRKELKISPRLMNLITNFQDTVHDTAITYHRKLRDKAITKSELDEIDGIGKVKKQALLKAFGSVEKIKQASIEDLINVKGINEELAKKIKKYEKLRSLTFLMPDFFRRSNFLALENYSDLLSVFLFFSDFIENLKLKFTVNTTIKLTSKIIKT